MTCVLGDKVSNMEKAIVFIKQAIHQGAKLIVLPELFSTGYSVEELDEQLAESLEDGTVTKLIKLAKEHDVYLAGAIIEKVDREGELFDTAFLIGPEGLVGKHRKIQLWNGEKNRFSKGDAFSVFNTEIGKIGLQICYEIGFPEGARIQALKGADLVLYPSAFGLPRLYAWDIATRSRALENGIYVVAANRMGADRNVKFAANSKITSPKGSVLVTAEEEEKVIFAEIDLDQVKEQKATIPYLYDLDPIRVINNFSECLMSEKNV